MGKNARSKLAITVFVLNVLAAIYAFVLCHDERVFIHLSQGYWGSNDFPFFLLFSLSLINVAFCWFFSRPEGNDILSLWLKRRRLEEELRIKELEDKN